MRFALKSPCVYILASKPDGVLYVGVTSDLWSRVSEHKQDLRPGFTKTHGIHTLVYFEFFETMEEAIKRETRLKKWNRAWKVRLIRQTNPAWRDMFNETWGDVADSGRGGQTHRE
jgi:putative endonuclease